MKVFSHHTNESGLAFLLGHCIPTWAPKKTKWLTAFISPEHFCIIFVFLPFFPSLKRDPTRQFTTQPQAKIPWKPKIYFITGRPRTKSNVHEQRFRLARKKTYTKFKTVQIIQMSVKTLTSVFNAEKI